MALDRVLHGNQPLRSPEQVMAERAKAAHDRRVQLCLAACAGLTDDELHGLSRLSDPNRLNELAVIANDASWAIRSNLR